MTYPLKIYNSESQYCISGGVDIYNMITPGVLYHIPEVTDSVGVGHDWKLNGFYSGYQDNLLKELVLPIGLVIDRGNSNTDIF